MYIIVKELIAKCTDKEEGLKLAETCLEGIEKHEIVRVSFDGIGFITEDFIYGFWGTVATVNKDHLKQIKHVRTENRVRSKIKDFYQKMGHKSC